MSDRTKIRPLCWLCNRRIYSRHPQRLGDSPDPVHSGCAKKVLEKRYAGHARWR